MSKRTDILASAAAILAVIAGVYSFRFLAFGAQATRNLASVSAPGSCPDIMSTDRDDADIGHISVNRSSKKNLCRMVASLSGVSPSRHFVMTENGEFSVTVQIAGSSNSASMGAREFFIFPRTDVPFWEKIQNGSTVRLHLASGDFIDLDAQSGRILESSPALRFRDTQRFSLNNNGGIEISSADRIVMDCGWAQGSTPATLTWSKSNPESFYGSGSCTITDPHGRTCSAGYRELFRYNYKFREDDPATGLGPRERKLKFSSDDEFAAFLRAKCPAIDRSFLGKSAPASAPADTATKPVQSGKSGSEF